MTVSNCACVSAGPLIVFTKHWYRASSSNRTSLIVKVAEPICMGGGFEPATPESPCIREYWFQILRWLSYRTSVHVSTELHKMSLNFITLLKTVFGIKDLGRGGVKCQIITLPDDCTLRWLMYVTFIPRST